MQNNGIPIDTDRDLLIKLATDVKYIKETIKDLSDHIKQCDVRYDDEFNKITERIESLERWRAYLIGIATAISFILVLLSQAAEWFK